MRQTSQPSDPQDQLSFPALADENSSEQARLMAKKAEALQMNQILALRDLAKRLLEERPAGAVPLGTLELLLSKTFKAVIAVDPEVLIQDPELTIADYVRMLNACTKLAEALVKVELVKAKMAAEERALISGGIPQDILAEVEEAKGIL
jgi:hypothetical protein